MEKIWLQHYPAGVPAEIDIRRYNSLVEIFDQACAQFAEKPAFSNFGTELSYQQLKEYSEQFANYLHQELKIPTGERLAVMLPNILSYPIVLLGALKAGLIVVNVNPLYTAQELLHQLSDAKVHTVVILENFAHVLATVRPKTSVKNVIVARMGDLFPIIKGFAANLVVKYVKKLVPDWNIPDAISFKTALKAGKDFNFKPVPRQLADTAFLQYTGGTTGVAKGAVLSHGNLVANIEQIVAWAGQGLTPAKEVMITALPLYHIFSLTANCLSFVMFGACHVLITDPRDISGMIKQLSKLPFSLITGVNTLFNALVNHPEFAKLDFSHLKLALGGGAAVQAAVAEKWLAVTGLPLLEGYGLTEASPVITVTPLDSKAYSGSIGLPVPSTDVKLLDEQDQVVAQGEIGELCVKGPQVMQEYWHQPEETRKVFTADGFLRTGDMARMDERGYLYLVDRKKDMILVSGFNAYPSEIENTLTQHPGVLEAAVIGLADENTGEKIKAFVVRKDRQLRAEDLIAFCRTQLTGYKIPKEVEFIESLPKSNVGKILRRALKA